MTILEKLPSVLTFKRGHVISDGLMFSIMPNGEKIPIEVIRQGIRGTQNSLTKKDNKVEHVANVQITEIAKLNSNSNILGVDFSLCYLPLLEALHACVGKNNAQIFREKIKDFLNKSKNSSELSEVASRYARNIGNGCWLWRNSTMASKIEIEVWVGNNDGQDKLLVNFDALSMPRRTFENYTDQEKTLAAEIVKQMQGDSQRTLMVRAILTLRVAGAEIFPSQNYIEKKTTGFARSLYKIGHPKAFSKTSDMNLKDIRIMGHAALRDQKISNAIRTIDTWYPAYGENNFPIAVEPIGANLENLEFYRHPSNQNSCFDYLAKLIESELNEHEKLFLIACIERGGVFNGKEKTKPASDNKKNKDKSITNKNEELQFEINEVP